MPIVFDWGISGEEFGGGGLGEITMDYGYSAQSDIPITQTYGWSDVPIDPGLIRDKILGENGNGNGDDEGFDWTGLIGTTGGPLILGLIILGMSGFRG